MSSRAIVRLVALVWHVLYVVKKLAVWCLTGENLLLECNPRPVRRGGSVGSNEPPRCTKSVRLSNVTLGLAAILYTCQEMQYTDMLQTRAYQQLEVQLEGGALVFY